MGKKDHKPSKKVWLVAFGAMGVLIFSVVSSGRDDHPYPTQNISFYPSSLAAQIFPDSDGDGLFNWEETLLGTDAHNADSDGDGVMDGVQYEGRKRIPNLSISDSIFTNIQSIEDSLANATNPIDSLTLEPELLQNHFVEHDLKIVSGDSTTTSEYFKEMLIVMNDYVDVFESEALETIEHWLTTYAADDIKELATISERDRQFAVALSRLEVPEDLVAVHLELINALYLGGLAIENIEDTIQDPTAGMFKAAGYASYRSKRSQAIVKLTQYVNDRT